MFQMKTRGNGLYRAVPSACIALCAYLAISPAQAEENDKAVSVCEVFAHGQDYAMRLVRVEGELWVGRHSVALLDKCPNTQASSPTAICLKSSGELHAPPVPFVTSGVPLDALAIATGTLLDQKTGFRARAVIEGQLFFAEKGRGGFCALNHYRVMMVTKQLISYSAQQAAGGADKETAQK
jgi:hypothetical protein